MTMPRLDTSSSPGPLGGRETHGKTGTADTKPVIDAHHVGYVRDTPSSAEPDTVQQTLDNIPLAKLDAHVAPTVNDDSGDGYGPGSQWVDLTHDKEYVCVDATVGAAVWLQTTRNIITLERLFDLTTVVAGKEYPISWVRSQACTINSVTTLCDSGTECTIKVGIRAAATMWTTGSDVEVQTAGFSVSDTYTTDSSLDNTAVAADKVLVVKIISIDTGAPTRLFVGIELERT